MPSFLDRGGRRSGRTTNLIEHALRLDAAGRAVYIQCGNQQGVEHIREMLRRFCLEKYGREPSSSIKLETWPSMTMDFNCASGEVKLPGAHPRCCVLIDHYAMAQRWSGVLERFHRYDVPFLEPLE